MVAPKKAPVKTASEKNIPVKKIVAKKGISNGVSMVKAQAAPKMAEKVDMKNESCNTFGCFTMQGCCCACCKKVTLLYIIIALFLAVSLTKHVFYYAMHKNDPWRDRGSCNGQQYIPNSETEQSQPTE